MDPDEILMEGMLQVDHDSAWPRSASDAHTGLGGAFVRAVGTALAEIATFVSLMADRPELKTEASRAFKSVRPQFDLRYPYKRIT